MSAWHVLFAWPTGAIWGNWIDDLVCLTLGFIGGRWGLKTIHSKLERQHQERLAQADRHAADAAKHRDDLHAQVLNAIGSSK